MTAQNMSMVELALFVGRLEERLTRAEQRQAELRKIASSRGLDRDKIIAHVEIDSAEFDLRIEQALAVANSRSLDLYRKDRDRIPVPGNPSAGDDASDGAR